MAVNPAKSLFADMLIVNGTVNQKLSTLLEYYLYEKSFPTADIYDRVQEICKVDGLDTECLGGGRIEHNPDKKYLKVYGYSQVRVFFSIYTYRILTYLSLSNRVLVKLIIWNLKEFC